MKSFPYIENLNLGGNEQIFYFGDIDFEGINIFLLLQEKYSEYNILPYLDGYKKMLELEKSPKDIRANQNIKNDNIEKFISFFDEKYQEKLKYIFENKKYIPQEILNYDIMCKENLW